MKAALSGSLFFNVDASCTATSVSRTNGRKKGNASHQNLRVRIPSRAMPGMSLIHRPPTSQNARMKLIAAVTSRSRQFLQNESAVTKVAKDFLWFRNLKGPSADPVDEIVPAMHAACFGFVDPVQQRPKWIAKGDQSQQTCSKCNSKSFRPGRQADEEHGD